MVCSESVRNHHAGTVTLADVAREAGVSLTTASQALSGKERVARKTREHVGAVAQRLGYEGNPLAIALRGGFDVRKVKLFSTDLDLGVRTQRLRDIQSLLRREGYLPSLAVFGEQENQEATIQAVCQQRPCAILVNAATSGTPAASVPLSTETLAALKAYQHSGGLVISYPTALALDCDQVVLLVEESVRRAIRHLIAVGHSRIGMRSHGNRSSLIEPLVVQELEAAGLLPDPEWFCWEGLYEEGGRLLAEKFLAAPPETRPTAFFIINDVSASAFIAQLARHGVRVPDDVSVIGYDNSPAAWCGLVPLTTLDTRSEAIAQAVNQLFLSRVRGEYSGPARRVELEQPLIERESVAPPPKP